MTATGKDLVIDAARKLSGQSHEWISYWYASTRIAEFHGLTACELVEAGRVDDVLKYLERSKLGRSAKSRFDVSLPAILVGQSHQFRNLNSIALHRIDESAVLNDNGQTEELHSHLE